MNITCIYDQINIHILLVPVVYNDWYT